MIYFCCDARRRQALRGPSTLNGIDFLEVVDDAAMPDPDRQRTLLVNFRQSTGGQLDQQDQSAH